MDRYISGYLEDFLNFLDAAKEQLSISEAELSQTNIDLQDLQHFIEFGSAGGKERLKTFNLYRKTRQKRRNAKENIEQCSPVVEWASKHSKQIQELRELLGQLRKIESQQSNRAYAVRGHILDDLTNKSHLSGR